MALNIDCRNCENHEVVNEEENEAYCKHYNAEIALDKHLDNCPGGVFITQPKTDRKDPRPKGDPDPTRLIEGLSDQLEVLDKKIFDTGQRLDGMEVKFNQLLEAVKSLSGDKQASEGNPSTPPETSQGAPAGATRRPIKKATKKTAKKKVAKKK